MSEAETIANRLTQLDVGEDVAIEMQTHMTRAKAITIARQRGHRFSATIDGDRITLRCIAKGVGR